MSVSGISVSGTCFNHESCLFIGCRVDFEKIIKESTEDSSIYFVGRPSLADNIAKLCTKYNQTLIKDSTNSQRGSSDKGLMINYMKYTLYTTIATILFGIVLSIYLRL